MSKSGGNDIYGVAYENRTHADGRVLGFALLLSLGTAVAIGLIPALQSSQPDLNASLAESSRAAAGSAPGHRRTRTGVGAADWRGADDQKLPDSYSGLHPQSSLAKSEALSVTSNENQGFTYYSRRLRRNYAQPARV